MEQELHGCLLSDSVVLCLNGLELERELQILLQVGIGDISVQGDSVTASRAPAEPDWIRHRPRTTDPMSFNPFDHIATLDIFVVLQYLSLIIRGSRCYAERSSSPHLGKIRTGGLGIDSQGCMCSCRAAGYS